MSVTATKSTTPESSRQGVTSMTTKRLKRAVIKEELVELTGSFMQALILNQFLFWGERVDDLSAYINEEKADNDTQEHGWVYKTAKDLVSELMLDASEVTVRRYVAALVSAGYINERHNPNKRWDRTMQYRANIVKIQEELQARGYALEGFPLLNTNDCATFKTKNGSFNLKAPNSIFEGAIPKTTTEITHEESTGASAPRTQVYQGHPPTEQTPVTVSTPAAPPVVSKQPAYQHPAVQAFVAVYGRKDITLTQFNAIAARVGTTSDDLARWQGVLEYWQLNGHKRESVGKMLTCYDERAPKAAPVDDLAAKIKALDTAFYQEADSERRQEIGRQLHALKQKQARGGRAVSA